MAHQRRSPRTASSIRRRSALTVALVLGCFLEVTLMGPLAAQTDSATVVAGPRYERGAVGEWLLGSDYRDLWTTPIRVPILDLERFAGGLTPTEVGGGLQTTSLRFIAADGREYAFRSVHKRPHLAEHPDLRGALVGDLFQDQVSSMVPAAPLAAARLARSAGLLHVIPHLFLMPDDPALGEFREAFAGMLGTLEERADEAEDGGPGFEGFTRIAGSDSMLDNVEDDSDHRIDSRRYLFARLLDIVIGDWDRHEDQWRWARLDSANGYSWTPIPRDRDYAFVDYDGLLLRLLRSAVPNAVRFEPELDDLAGLLLNGEELDAQILAGLERPAWDSVTALVQSRLTDAAIEEAIGALPPEYVALKGEALGERLRARRDLLGEASHTFYHRIAAVPTIYTTDEDERAVITRLADGAVAVTVEALQDSGDSRLSPYFHRTFSPSETREIRLFLRGGDDRALVHGNSMDGILVRVIGGGGEDVLVDSSGVWSGGRWTTLHDSDDGDRLGGREWTRIDRRSYEEPNDGTPRGVVHLTAPDWGRRLSFRPSVGYSTTRGALIGGGATRTRYGFRRHPYISRIEADLRFATRWSDFELRAGGDLTTLDPALRIDMELVASRIDALRFYGFGNETTITLPSERYVVRRELLSAEANLLYELADQAWIWGGVVGTRSEPRLLEGSPLLEEAPSGHEAFGSLGFQSGVVVGAPVLAPDRATYRLALDASATPVSSRPSNPFGAVRAEASAGLPFPRSGSMRLRARAGGRYVWGDYPFYESAFLGGRESVRGLRQWRYAGDAMLFGGMEAMAPIGRLPFLLNWRVAGFVFADAGRVFLSGEESNRWHSAPGAGLALSALDYTVRVSYARGPSGRLYLELSDPYE